jgi:hypothetical protein
MVSGTRSRDGRDSSDECRRAGARHYSSDQPKENGLDIKVLAGTFSVFFTSKFSDLCTQNGNSMHDSQLSACKTAQTGFHLRSRDLFGFSGSGFAY